MLLFTATICHAEEDFSQYDKFKPQTFIVNGGDHNGEKVTLLFGKGTLGDPLLISLYNHRLGDKPIHQNYALSGDKIINVFEYTKNFGSSSQYVFFVTEEQVDNEYKKGIRYRILAAPLMPSDWEGPAHILVDGRMYMGIPLFKRFNSCFEGMNLMKNRQETCEYKDKKSIIKGFNEKYLHKSNFNE